MIKKGKILTGGNISEHYPLGADNSALYSWAATFLKNLDLKDKSYSRYFAVPETNKTGSRIDWYCNGAYYQGDPLIVPWENADEPERTAALKELDGMMDGLAKMAERLRSKPGLSADMKLFVQFIAGDPEKGTGPMALETPGKKFIYIVEGHPVLTFWGFTEKGVETAGSDPFYFLRTPKAPEPAPAPAPEPAPAPAPAPEPEPAPAPAPEPAPEPAPATETKVKRKGFWALLPAWLWWILLPLLLLLLLLLLWFFLLKPHFFPAPALSPLPQISAPLQDGGSEDKAAVQPEEPQEEATEESAPEEKPDPERTDVINSVQPGASAGTADSAAPGGAMPSGNAPEAAPDAEQPANPDTAPDAGEPAAPADQGSNPDAEQPAAPADQGSNPDAEQPSAPADQAANPDAAANADQGADTGAAPSANGAVNPDAAQNGSNAPDAASAAGPQGQAAAAPDGRTAATAAGGADQGTRPVKPIPRPMKAEALRNSVMTPGSELSADSGLRDEKHRTPIKMNFKWNGDGSGEEIIRKSDGTECRGPVRASQTGGNVSISPSGSIACTDGSSFRAQKIDCHADSSGNSRCAMSGNGGRSVPVVLSDGKKQGAGK